MCNKQSAKADVEVKFESQKTFSLFGQNISTCQAALGAGAHVEVTNKDRLTYRLNVYAKCECDGLLKLLNVAIDKSIGNPPEGLRDVPFIIDRKHDANWRSRQAYLRQGLGFTSRIVTCAWPALAPLKAGNVLRAGASTTTEATAIDSQLVYAMEDATPEQVTAYSHLNLYAQAAARAVLKSKGVDITKTDYLQTKDWFDAVVYQLTDLGFTVKSASGGQVRQDVSSGDVDIGSLLTTVVGTYLGAAELESFKQLATLLSKDPSDAGTHDFMTFWWNKASTKDGRTTVAFGPIKNDQGMASVTVVYLVLDVEFTDWHSLFINYHHEGVLIHSAAITLDLDMQVYAKNEAAIFDAISGAIANHIKTQELSFD
ncbi:hypothetical protein [Pseudomonas eucalypticola]|uniref:Uncharacterized protein n=1 Tax=Pseudomonas eucalypticola TaxID=2599595 RepID=A0A7D5H606_9PSED|nr:hypothetical protein [Pseudomonas eucalypticola]QKZ04849.1 hypothetical protein HWQ56_14030 [Pseudomonas eucalypticola]